MCPLPHVSQSAWLIFIPSVLDSLLTSSLVISEEAFHLDIAEARSICNGIAEISQPIEGRTEINVRIFFAGFLWVASICHDNSFVFILCSGGAIFRASFCAIITTCL